MAEPRLRNVIFDLGGVLIDWDPRHLYRQLLPGDEPAVERFLATVCTREWHVQHDVGVRYAQTIPALVARFPEQRELIEAYDQQWGQMMAGQYDDAVAIVRALKDRRRPRIPLYALTNWPADKFHLARERFAFLQWFDGIVVSGCIGLVKPDPRIFQHLLETYHLAAAETLFIDDSAANVEAAQTAGLAGIHYHGADPLRGELRRRGLL